MYSFAGGTGSFSLGIQDNRLQSTALNVQVTACSCSVQYSLQWLLYSLKFTVYRTAKVPLLQCSRGRGPPTASTGSTSYLRKSCSKQEIQVACNP